MNLQTYLDQKNISKYRLSKLSGVPSTTIVDICAGRSEISRCTAKTVQQLARALNCTMEAIMMMSSYAADLVLQDECEYMECGLPDFLRESVQAMKTAWEKIDSGERYLHWDCDYCNLQTDINNAEVNGIISSEQAWYLREKYLRLERM